MQVGRISIGLAGALDHRIIRALAPRMEQLGFLGLWLNDTANGDSLAGLAVAAAETTTLRLGTGVIPLDRRPAGAIGDALRRLSLPDDRLTVGIGSGSPTHGLGRVSGGISALRELTDAPILVGGLGPKMRRLGAKRADGVVLNWLTPSAARDAAADLHRDAPAGHPVRSVLYARTIVDAAARAALAAEAARYGKIPSYAANLSRIGATALATTIDGSEPGTLAERASEYTNSVDELVLRVIVSESSLDAYVRFLERVVAL